jgi:DNA-binding transcriptional LysR family regulator
MSIQMESNNVEVGLLRTFLAVVEHGSLGKTAVAVNKTQPAISQQMLRLEKIVGQRLFARGREGMKLTRQGQLLTTYAHRAVELNEEILLRLRGEPACRQMTVGMSADVALVGLAVAMKRFQSPHSDLDLRVLVTAPNRLDALLKAGKLDWAIGDPSLMTGTPTERWSVPLEWAAGNGFDFDESRPIPLILFEGPCPWQNEMLDSLHRAGRDWRITFESASLDAILSAVQSGLGITALPAVVIQDFALTRFHAIHLPHTPVVEFGMFRAATCVASSAHITVESRLTPIFDGHPETVAVEQASLVGHEANISRESKTAHVWMPRRTPCRVRYRTDRSLLPGASSATLLRHDDSHRS